MRKLKFWALKLYLVFNMADGTRQLRSLWSGEWMKAEAEDGVTTTDSSTDWTRTLAIATNRASTREVDSVGEVLSVCNKKFILFWMRLYSITKCFSAHQTVGVGGLLSLRLYALMSMTNRTIAPSLQRPAKPTVLLADKLCVEKSEISILMILCIPNYSQKSDIGP